MASSTLSKLAIARRSIWNSKQFLASKPRYIQASTHQEASTTCEKTTEAIKQGADHAMKASGDMKTKAVSTAQQMSQITKDKAGKVSETAQDIGDKAKQTVQDAWGSAKDTAQNVKDNLLGKADKSKEAVKQNAEQVTKSMNTKN
ncbi:hypothetical protein WN944_003428 [Citrus x changshan-huyou]|uniref:Late embryogenesis abundant protein n=1 Tax=Citrus x changshan-huyou TaxID=2935761 RepID=A0AAP0QGU6_9ROSI